VNITADADFDAAAAPFRHELVVHCYRMLGSVGDAEDVAQETLIRAWTARDRYDAERASLRTWLYRIATNACLTALESRPRRRRTSVQRGRGRGPAGDVDRCRQQRPAAGAGRDRGGRARGERTACAR